MEVRVRSGARGNCSPEGCADSRARATANRSRQRTIYLPLTIVGVVDEGTEDTSVGTDLETGGIDLPAAVPKSPSLAGPQEQATITSAMMARNLLRLQKFPGEKVNDEDGLRSFAKEFERHSRLAG